MATINGREILGVDKNLADGTQPARKRPRSRGYRLDHGDLLAALMAASVAGCATPYKPIGLMGGYSEVRLNADTFQISVQGNGYTSTDRAQKIALLRAAELTIAAGAERFVMVGGGVSENYAGSEPVVVNQVGNTLIASGGDAIVKPSGSYTIRIVRPNDPAFGSAFDARLIQKQLLPQLGG